MGPQRDPETSIDLPTKATQHVSGLVLEPRAMCVSPGGGDSSSALASRAWHWGGSAKCLLATRGNCSCRRGIAPDRDCILHLSKAPFTAWGPWRGRRMSSTTVSGSQEPALWV